MNLGSFYYLSREEKIRITGGGITKRAFSWPMFASGTAAYSAMLRGDEAFAGRVWKILLSDLRISLKDGGFIRTDYAHSADKSPAQEIRCITTNFVSQWCLNVIMCLEFIRDALPQTKAELEEYMKSTSVQV